MSEHTKLSETPPFDGMTDRQSTIALTELETAAVAERIENDARPLFDRPVSWVVAKSEIPGILKRMKEALPGIRKALQEGQESRYEAVGIYLVPEEAEGLWEFFEEERKNENAAVGSKGKEGDLRNVASGSAEKGEMGKASTNSPKPTG